MARAMADRLDTLLAQARAGDERAYRAFLAKAAGQVRGFVARRIGADAEVEDIVQQCLIALHDKRETIDPDRPVAAWITAIARYKLVDHFRRTGRARFAPLDDDRLSAPPEPMAGIDVAALLDRISDDQAEAIRMTRIEGLTMQEASERSGVGVSALKLRVHRGMARLRTLVGSEAEGG